MLLPENKHLRRGLFCLYGAMGIILIWLLLRYALPWLMPFIVAVIVTRLMEPAVHAITERFRVRRGFASAICTIVIFAALIALTAVIIGRTVIELTAFVKDLPTLLTSLTKTISVIGEKIDRYIKTAPPEIQNYLKNAIDGLVRKIADLPATLSDDALGLLSEIAKFTPKLILFFFTCALSVFFFSCGYKDISAFILRQIPKNRHASLKDFRTDLLVTFGKWVKAELILASITYAEMATAFLIMRIDFALVLAFLVALVDFLPVLGSGAFLIPWAILTLIGGNINTALALVVVFAVNTVVRSILEPKMIGSQIGLPSIATLIAMYVGFCSVGVTGMVLFPIGLIMLKHLNDKGYIKLWKN